jgi:nitroimidazol reductase NimA-like FMN-containing flavoprotein (pyridoxamine 5'-phosphate oxidase superfamily)
MSEIPQTERTTLRRLPKRGVYDRTQIHTILDEGLVCHVGFVVQGQPYVVPTLHVRVGERLYLHGSPASRMLNSLAQGIEVCVTVTLIDGLVLARSAFHHSVNYRSAMLFGTASVVADPGEKLRALHCLMDHAIKGRWEETRSPTAAELARTLVLALPIDEASAKVRTGPPLDDEEDYSLPFWAGVLPLAMTALEPVADSRLAPGILPPAYTKCYKGPGSGVPAPDQ